MTFSIFKTYYVEVSPRVAVQLAIAQGISPTQATLWANTVRKFYA